MEAYPSKKAVIINTASYERVSYALSLATVAASLGEKVCVLFGHGGIVRLRKGLEDSVGEETEEWIRETIRRGIENRALPKISEQLSMLRRFGGLVYACPTAMALHNLTIDDLTGELDGVRGLSTLLVEDAKDATIIYV